MSEREQASMAFLDANGFAAAKRIPMPGDASTRRYERLALNGTSYILMDAPPLGFRGETAICTPGMTEAERRAAGDNATRRLAASRVDAFLCINQWLNDSGFCVPKIIAAAPADGFALLEDLGDGQYWALLQQGGVDERELYRAATDVLIKLDQLSPPAAATWQDCRWPLLEYDRLAMQTEANLLPEWYGRHHGVTITPEAIAAYEAAWNSVLDTFNDAPRKFIARDYHSPNLMWLPARDGIQRVGILDHQDAVLGHPAYNLMFLLNDARRDVPPAIQDEMLARYFAATGCDETGYRAAYAAYQALNNARIAGIFCRLNYRDGKPGYMQHLPRVERYLRASLNHPACAALRRWFETYLPDFLP